MDTVIKPKSEAQVVEALRWANAEQSPVEVVGHGTKRSLGRTMQTSATLDLSLFSGIELYEPEELVITAGPGTPLTEIEAALADRGQAFAFEPPDLSALLGSTHAGTIGGIIACNLSGPRRPKAGAVRDHVLGLTAVSGRAEVFKAGGRVVKNVTGYDLPKLLTGSYGTLAAMTSVTLKCLPAPQSEETIVVHGLSNEQAAAAMSIAMQSACEVAGAAHAGHETYLRLEGIPPSVAYRREKLVALLKSHGKIGLLETEASRRQWRTIRDVMPLANDRERAIWRISVAPSDGGKLLDRISQQIDARGYLDWAGGLIWLAVPASDDCGAGVIRGVIEAGHATLVRAPAQCRGEAFQSQPPALAALSKRVKHSFDPNGILNPGRMSAAY